MKKHFKLTDNTKTLPDGTVLHQIECTRDCKWAMKGELGGWIEKEGNLSDNAWVYDNAWVSGDARVYGGARVSGDAWVYGGARVSGGALIENSRDYCCFQSFGSRNDTTTAFRQKDGSILIRCGCFSGSMKEFVEAVEKTHGANQYGREYLAIAEVIKVRFGID